MADIKQLWIDIDNGNQAAVLAGVEAGAQKIPKESPRQKTKPAVKQAKLKKIKTQSDDS
jgi:hypothetical protein